MTPSLRLAVLISLTTGPATAQPSPSRLNATIAALDGDILTLRTEDGALTAINLPPNVRIGTQVDRTLADIKPGEFVGAAALRGRDGKLHAQEVHIFPESLRGTGEGHRPMDLPDQTMTNANVDGVADANTGNGIAESSTSRILTLRYPGGEQSIEVAPDIRIVGLLPGDRSLLIPGATVTLRATRTQDGALTAISIQAEKDGIKPLP